MASLDKHSVDLTHARHANTVTYGGALDIANGATLDLDQLKFAALFFEHVLVHDGYFFCYGPLFSALKREASFPERTQLTALLRAGALLPAIREGDSLESLWTRPRLGVAPGSFACVEAHEGTEVLARVDASARAYANWPGAMAQAHTIMFPQLLVRLASQHGNPIHDLLVSRKLIVDGGVSAMFSEFRAEITANAANPKYRRGDIEGLIWRHVAPHVAYDGRRPVNPRLYEALEAVASSQGSAPVVSAAWRLLGLATTTYQAYHAIQYGTIGGLFPRHDETLVESGLYDHMKVLRRLEDKVESIPICPGSLDVSQLTIADIVALRGEEQYTLEFAGYVERLRNTRAPGAGESFYEANTGYVDYLVDCYLPYVLRRYPKAGWVEPTMKWGGTALTMADTLIKIVKTPWMNALMVGDASLFVSVAASAAVAAAAGSTVRSHAKDASDLVEGTRRRFRSRRFKTKNYGLFAK